MAYPNELSFVNIINNFALEEDYNGTFEKVITAFRHLRNVCANGREIQNNIISDGNILKSTHKILSTLLSDTHNNNEACLCLQIGLQFIGNLIVNNNENQTLVWNNYQNLLGECLSFKNTKVPENASMILYNIFLGHPEYIVHFSHYLKNLISLASNKGSSEFPLYLIQLFIKKNVCILNGYDALEINSRLMLIEIIKDLIDDNEPVHSDLINFFIEQFLKHSDNILNILEISKSLSEAPEVIKILDLLTSLSTINDCNLQILQNHMSLVVCSLKILKVVHNISKEPDNNFSMIQKLSALNEIEKNLSIQDDPCFGFKSSLIRLIGNLCWKNVHNQNKVRELECIPILLECCNIDGRNPFIIQWTILAIRNICEGNLENQNYIAAMPRKGTLDIEKLKKMGIVLNKEKDGNSISICPLELDK